MQRWFEPVTSSLPQIRLRGEDENYAIHAEINLVINKQVDELSAEFRLSDERREKLANILLQMQHRTYLWLKLTMEGIQNRYQSALFANEVQIDFLPTTVDHAYEQILQKVNEEQRPNARKVLLIIVGARRPLTISEMALALGSAHAQEHHSSSIQEVDGDHLEKQIRLWCGLFVFINHSQLFLIHQTAKEFLVAQNSNFSPILGRWKSCLSMLEIESKMAGLCVTYLYLRQQDHHKHKHGDDSQQGDRDISTASPVIHSQSSEEQDRFFEYCAEHWTSHLQNDTVEDDKETLSNVLSLYATDGDRFHAWFPVMWKASYPYTSTPAW